MKNTKARRMLELDVLRGFAVMSVVLYHYTTRYNELFGHRTKWINFDLGNLGVQLFFIISGFVIFMTLKGCSNINEFIYKRATRLYPAYISAVIITFVSVSLYVLNGREVSVRDAIINLTMFEGLIPGVNYVDGAYWSLTVELIFYFIMGFLFSFGLLNRIEIVAVFWLSCSLIIKSINFFLDFPYLNLIETIGIMNYCQYFIAGIMFYRIKSGNKVSYHLVLGLCLIYDILLNGLLLGSVTLGFFLIFYCISYEKLKFINSKPLMFLGTISYSLYLIHQNIGYIIINFLEKNGFTNELFILVPIAISVFLASGITFFIEKPMLKLFRKRISAKEVKNEVTLGKKNTVTARY